MAPHRTSLILDTDLLARAAQALGTSSKTETVRSALERAIRQAHVKNLVAWELPDSAIDGLDEQRRGRDFA